MLPGISLTLASAGLLSLLSYSGTLAADLPIVDLGYVRQRASSYDSAVGFYGFEGIRYARAPTGKRRFRKPHPPKKDRSVVQDGSGAPHCISSDNSWKDINRQALDNYLAGKPLGVTRKELHAANDTSNFQYSIPSSESEDCLFLNVAVPKQIFEAKHSKGSKGAPVLIWIYGGGYINGNRKDVSGAAGLISRSLKHGREGIIFVSMEYRLGAFGWLAGPTVQKDGVANAGLWDQRFAMQWVQKYIKRFGGDPDRVTLLGESAGAGSILHHITAFGGSAKGAPPFQQAILQSPGFHQQVSPKLLENQYNRLLELSKAKNLQELRQLPVAQLAKANAMQVYQSQFGFYTYGPAVDSSYVPALPGQLLLRGKYHKKLKVIAAHNAHEGLRFVDPFIKKQKQFKKYVYLMFPTSSPKIVNHITEDLYPPKYGGSHGYTDAFGRAAKIISENAFSCATHYLGKAFGDHGYSYEFAIPPALHGDDLAYSFWDGTGNTGLANTTVAVVMQDYITTFARHGKPTTPGVAGVPKFKPYSKGSRIIRIHTHKITSAADPERNKRCDFWQRAPFAK